MTRNEQIIALRQEGLTMREIGDRLGVSKAVACGVIDRHAPELKDPSLFRGPEPRTLYQRCDALHARMDAILAETKDIPRVPVGKGQTGTPSWGFPRPFSRGVFLDD